MDPRYLCKLDPNPDPHKVKSSRGSKPVGAVDAHIGGLRTKKGSLRGSVNADSLRFGEEWDPYSHYSEKLDPDPH
jgi:hypothetical protein